MYKVNINFSQAEKDWRSNKIYRGNGVFSYKINNKKTSKDRARNKDYINKNTKLHQYNLRSLKSKEIIHTYNTRSRKGLK